MSTPSARLFFSVAARLLVALAVEEPALGQMSAIEMHKRFFAPQAERKATETYVAIGDDLASVTTVLRWQNRDSRG